MTDTNDRAESGAGGEASVVRSEEQLTVRTASRTSRRVIVRKVIVTEEVTVTVPVRREEVRFEEATARDDEPSDEATVAAGGEAVLYETVIHEEVPVVTTRVVPRERVRLVRSVVSDRRVVTEPVRRERVAVDEAMRRR